MTTPLEHRLTEKWNQLQSLPTKTHKVEAINSEITEFVTAELNAVESRSKNAMKEANQTIQRGLEEMLMMQQEFVSGVQIWTHQSLGGVQQLCSSQASLKTKVAETAATTVRRKEAMMLNQKRRSEALAAEVGAIIAEARLKIEACGKKN